MSDVRLRGFERDLLEAVRSGFRFSGPALAPYELIPGRNLFAQDMKEPELIAEAFADAALKYEPAKEPGIVFYRQPGSRRRKGVSHDGTLEISELVVLRAPSAGLQKAVDLLDEFDDWLSDEGVLLLQGFKIGDVTIAQEATAFSRGGDDASFASSTVRFLAVPLIR